MCLTRPKEFRTTGKGYKVFKVSDTGRLRSLVQGKRKPIPTGKWIIA